MRCRSVQLADVWATRLDQETLVCELDDTCPGRACYFSTEGVAGLTIQTVQYLLLRRN